MQYVYILDTVIFTLTCIVLLLCRPLVITLCEESASLEVVANHVVVSKVKAHT